MKSNISLRKITNFIEENQKFIEAIQNFIDENQIFH